MSITCAVEGKTMQKIRVSTCFIAFFVAGFLWGINYARFQVQPMTEVECVELPAPDALPPMVVEQEGWLI